MTSPATPWRGDPIDAADQLRERDASAGASAEFAVRVAARRRLGLERHAPQFLHGPSLLRPVALEAIDAANYAVMELARLHSQYPANTAAHVAVRALARGCIDYANRAAGLLACCTGEVLDVAAVAVERLQGPAAGEYDFLEYLYRPSNLAELVDELADAHILCGFELERRRRQRADSSLDRSVIEAAAVTAAALGAWSIQIDRHIQHACPPPRPLALAA